MPIRRTPLIPTDDPPRTSSAPPAKANPPVMSKSRSTAVVPPETSNARVPFAAISTGSPAGVRPSITRKSVTSSSPAVSTIRGGTPADGGRSNRIVSARPNPEPAGASPTC